MSEYWLNGLNIEYIFQRFLWPFYILQSLLFEKCKSEQKKEEKTRIEETEEEEGGEKLSEKGNASHRSFRYNISFETARVEIY